MILILLLLPLLFLPKRSISYPSVQVIFLLRMEHIWLLILSIRIITHCISSPLYQQMNRWGLLHSIMYKPLSLQTFSFVWICLENNNSKYFVCNTALSSILNEKYNQFKTCHSQL